MELNSQQLVSVKRSGLYKIICFIAFTMGLSFFASGQLTKTVQNKLSATLTEEFEVLKANKKVKNGLYTVTDDNKNILVVGLYTNNKKDSIWSYYNPNGDLVQRYDFRSNQLLFNNTAPTDGTIVQPKYELAGTTVDASKANVEPPCKIGGVNYGFYLLFDIRSIPNEVRNELRNVKSTMSYVLSISEQGKLEGWDIVYKDESSDNPKVVRQSVRDLPADAYEFLAAKVDGKPVKSKLIYNIPLVVNENNSTKVGSNNTMMSTKNE